MAFSSTRVVLAAAFLSLAGIVPARAQEEPQLASEQPQFETETIPLYRVERTRTLLIPTRGRARALILNPDAVEVDSVTDSQILFRGLQMDSSVIHLFDDSGRRTIRIEVIELTSILNEMRQREEEAVRQKLGVPQRSLKFWYQGSERHLERGEEVSFANTSERNRTRTHDLTARMALPPGDFYGRMYLEQRRDVDLHGEEVTQPRHLSAELRKVDLKGLGPSDLVAGDKDLDLSNYTIDGRRYRGAGLFPSTGRNPYLEEKPALDRKLAVSLFGGEEREGFGLDLPAGLQKRSARSHFAGTKLAYGLWEDGHVYLTGLHRYGKGGDLRSDRVVAAGLNKAWWGEKVQLKGEAARGGTEGAYELEARTQLTNWMKTRNRFWDVGKRYRTVTGPVAEEGQIGWKGWAGLDLPYWRLAAVSLFPEATLYRDRNAVNPVNPREWNTSYTLGSSARLPGEYLFYGSTTYQDESASPLPYVNRRFDLNLSHEMVFREGWVHSVAPFVGYRYSEYDKSNNVPGFDATLKLYRTGVRASFARGFWGGATWSTGRLKESNPAIPPAVVRPVELVLEAGNDHTFRRVPATLNLSVRYEDVQQTLQKTHMPFANRNRFSADSRFSWRFDAERELFAEASVSRETPEIGGGNPVVDLSAQFGVRLLWDTGWAWTQKGRVTGSVFKDLNGNSRREPEEPGLASVRVYVEGGPETRTGADGRYALRVPEGIAVIRADPGQIPKGYFFTTPNNKEQLVASRRKNEADFGVSTEVEFRGIVFNDLDEDQQYRQGSDRPVQGVRMMLETGQSSVSSGDGFYSIRKASPGEHTLSIDLSSIPDGYRTLVPVQQAFQTKEGDVVQHDLPLKAQRSVWGSAFVDANGDGIRAAAEKGIGGIRIRLAGQQTVTDAEGAYRFSNVQPGRYAISADAAELPSGYRFASERPIEIEVPEEPFMRDRSDLAVVPLDAPPPRPETIRPAVSPAPRPAPPVEGEIPVDEFRERFPGASVPPGTQRIYLLPPSPEVTVGLYAQETLRSAIEQLIASEAAGLPAGIRVQLLPVPSDSSGLRRPGLIVKDFMLEPPLPDAGLPVAELVLGQPSPSLAGLVLQALRAKPIPGKALGATAVRDVSGELYWAWFLE